RRDPSVDNVRFARQLARDDSKGWSGFEEMWANDPPTPAPRLDQVEPLEVSETLGESPVQGNEEFALGIDYETAHRINPHFHALSMEPVSEALNRRKRAANLRHRGLRQLEVGLVTTQPVDEPQSQEIRVRP